MARGVVHLMRAVPSFHSGEEERPGHLAGRSSDNSNNNASDG